jgi:hypothetical protein
MIIPQLAKTAIRRMRSAAGENRKGGRHKEQWSEESKASKAARIATVRASP